MYMVEYEQNKMHLKKFYETIFFSRVGCLDEKIKFSEAKEEIVQMKKKCSFQ